MSETEPIYTKQSVVWDHFDRIDKDTAKCRLCQKILLKRGGST
jgi:hypothetical protein